MEEISPTIPSVVFLKYLHFRRSSHSCQGKIHYALYHDNLEDIQCPHCKSKNYYRHGFCYRDDAFVYKSNATAVRIAERPS